VSSPSPEMINVFIVVAAVAIVIQMAILVALYLSVRRSSTRMEAIADDLHKRTGPLLDAASAILVDSKPKIATITDNLSSATTSIRSQVERLDATVTDVIDRTRLQVIRADELVSRTMDKVEETTEMVQHSVLSPIRRLAGIASGLTVGLEYFFRRRRGSPEPETLPQDEELFI
jgi:ABC-type transporter Mla subunit MlaD